MLQLCKLSKTGSKPTCLVLRTILKHDPTSHLATARASHSVVYIIYINRSFHKTSDLTQEERTSWSRQDWHSVSSKVYLRLSWWDVWTIATMVWLSWWDLWSIATMARDILSLTDLWPLSKFQPNPFSSFGGDASRADRQRNSRVLIITHSSSFCMRVMNHNWSASKQRHHLQSVARISHHSALSEDSIVWDIVWVSPQGHRSVSASRQGVIITSLSSIVGQPGDRVII